VTSCWEWKGALPGLHVACLPNATPARCRLQRRRQRRPGFTNSIPYIFPGEGDGTSRNLLHFPSAVRGCVDVLAGISMGRQTRSCLADPGRLRRSWEFGDPTRKGEEPLELNCQWLREASILHWRFQWTQAGYRSNDGGYTRGNHMVNNGQGSFPNLDFISGPTFFRLWEISITKELPGWFSASAVQ